MAATCWYNGINILNRMEAVRAVEEESYG